MSRKTSRRELLKQAGAVGTVGMVGTAGCLGNLTGGASTFSIGFCNSITGSLDTFGQRNKRGKELAIEDINNVGLRGGELNIITEDTQSTEQAGISAAQKLVNQDQVPIVVGAVSSGVSLAIFQSVIQGSDVDQISQNSTSPDLTQYPALMRMSPPGKAQAGAIADLVSEDGHGSVAVSFINNAYGQGVADVFRESYSGEVNFFEAHNQGKSSYSGVVSSMMDADADAWVFVTYQPEFTTIATEAYNQGVTDKPLYGADSVKGPQVIQNVPENFLEGMKVVVPSAALTQDNYKTFASEFEEAYGTQPTAWSAYTYDAIVTAAIAAEAADEFSASGISTNLIKNVTRPQGQTVYTYQAAQEILADGGSGSDVNYEGVSGPIDLDQNGDPRAFLQITQVENGEYVTKGTIRG